MEVIGTLQTSTPPTQFLKGFLIIFASLIKVYLWDVLGFVQIHGLEHVILRQPKVIAGLQELSNVLHLKG